MSGLQSRNDDTTDAVWLIWRYEGIVVVSDLDNEMAFAGVGIIKA